MNENENSGEWRNFAILAVILIGTPFVIALLRPIIFGKIVPAVMYRPGEQIEIVEPTAEMATPIPIITPADLATIEASDQSNSDDSLETVPTVDGSAEATPDPTFAQPEPTAIPDSGSSEHISSDNGTTREHIVKSGQTLYQISVIYGVAVEDILRLNQIKDPNMIQAGFKIKIPNK